MDRWIALWPGEALPPAPLGWWALQFTPRVALLDGVVVLEVSASLRLFGGEAVLLGRVREGAARLGCLGACAAPTPRSARAWLVAHRWPEAQDDASAMPWMAAWQAPVQSWLDALPLQALAEVACHAETLAPMGCRTLGDVRRLPRAGLSRRFGAGLRQAMDRADGSVPDVLDWLSLPEVFDERLELPGRIEEAAAMMHGATTLLGALVAWLAGRQAGVSALTLHWRHDFHRRDAGPGGHCTVHLAEPTRDQARLQRLLAEHLAHVTLAGPVGELRLCADQVAPLPLSSDLLFAELGSAAAQLLSHAPNAPHASNGQAQHQTLQALLEHLSARLGAAQVRLGEVVPDHRPEQAQRWRPWSVQAAQAARASHRASAGSPSSLAWPLPTWLSPKPLSLALLGRAAQRDLPQYQGPLRLLAGPHRVESGWWDAAAQDAARDYYLALSPGAGLLWIFRERPGREAVTPASSPWFLHGWLA